MTNLDHTSLLKGRSTALALSFTSNTERRRTVLRAFCWSCESAGRTLDSMASRIVLLAVGLVVLGTGVVGSPEASATNKTRAISQRAVQSCLRHLVDKPRIGTGIVSLDGTKARVIVSKTNSANTLRCRNNSETTVYWWIQMQKNNGRFFRNSDIYTFAFHGEAGWSSNEAWRPLYRRYRCIPGPRARGINVVTHVKAEYEGKKSSRTYVLTGRGRHQGQVISPPWAKKYMPSVVGKVRC